MGCFNAVCGATGTEIRYEDSVYYGFLIDYGTNPKTGGVYPFDNYSFISPLMVGTYNDYGYIEEIDSDDSKNNEFSNFVLDRVLKSCYLNDQCVSSDPKLRNTKFQELIFSRERTNPSGFKTTLLKTASYDKIYIWMANKELVDYLISNLKLNKWLDSDYHKEQYELFSGIKLVSKSEDDRYNDMSSARDFGRQMNLHYTILDRFSANAWINEDERNIRSAFVSEYAESVKTMYNINQLMWHSKRFLTPTHVFGSQDIPWEHDRNYHSLVANFMENKVKENPEYFD